MISACKNAVRPDQICCQIIMAVFFKGKQAEEYLGNVPNYTDFIGCSEGPEKALGTLLYPAVAVGKLAYNIKRDVFVCNPLYEENRQNEM